jgi:hypothetical protein
MHDTGNEDDDTRKREITHRIATKQDLVDYYGVAPKQTMRAIVVLMDNEPVGMAGLVREQGMLKYFTEYKDELEPYLGTVAVLRPALKVMRWVRAAKIPVFSMASHDAGHRALQKVGFQHIQQEFYIWR